MTGAAHGIPRHVRGPMLHRQDKSLLIELVQEYYGRIDGYRLDYADIAGLDHADLVDLALKAEYDHE